MPSHTKDSVYETFCACDQGTIKTAKFSHANVVMLSTDAYDMLCDAAQTSIVKLIDDFGEACAALKPNSEK